MDIATLLIATIGLLIAALCLLALRYEVQQLRAMKAEYEKAKTGMNGAQEALSELHNKHASKVKLMEDRINDVDLKLKSISFQTTQHTRRP